MKGRENKEIGKIGEDYAAEYLKSHGYVVTEMNFRTPLGEIDIIAKKNRATVFIEVKTRTSDSLGPPYLSVTRNKQRHLIRNALCYLKRRALLNTDWRIDIVSVRLNRRYLPESIELIENAVEEY